MLNHSSPVPSPRMRRWALPFVAVGLATVVSACSSATGSAVTGSGDLRAESRDVGGFSTIELLGSGDVIIEQDGTESLSIEAEDNLLPDLTSDVSNGTLRLGTVDGVSLDPTLAITYRVTVKDLSGLQLSGSGSVTAAGITTPAISIDISGSGDVNIDGTADDQTVTISGSGNYRAGDLATLTSSAAISGSGNVSVDVRDAFEAEIDGSGNVTYTGSPQISQDISGSGELRRGE
jgi:Putative auto-transporter adhesin, head GIN domain